MSLYKTYLVTGEGYDYFTNGLADAKDHVATYGGVIYIRIEAVKGYEMIGQIYIRNRDKERCRVTAVYRGQWPQVHLEYTDEQRAKRSGPWFCTLESFERNYKQAENDAVGN